MFAELFEDKIYITNLANVFLRKEKKTKSAQYVVTAT